MAFMAYGWSCAVYLDAAPGVVEGMTPFLSARRSHKRKKDGESFGFYLASGQRSDACDLELLLWNNAFLWPFDYIAYNRGEAALTSIDSQAVSEHEKDAADSASPADVAGKVRRR